MTVQASTIDPVLLTVPEAARALAISVKTLSRLTKSEGIPVLKLGRSVRYRVADLEAWAASKARTKPSKGA